MPSSHLLSRLLPLLLLASSSLAGAGLALTALEAIVPQAAIAQKKSNSSAKPSKPRAGRNSGNIGPNSTSTSVTPDLVPTGNMIDGGKTFP